MATLKTLANKVVSRIAKGDDVAALRSEYVDIRARELFASFAFEPDASLTLKRGDVCAALQSGAAPDARFDVAKSSICNMNNTWELRRFSAADAAETDGTLLREAKSNFCIDVTHYQATDVAAFVAEADKQLQQWTGTDWDIFVGECFARAGQKQDEMAQIETIIAQRLNGTSIKYNLTKNATQAKLAFKLHDNQQIIFEMAFSALAEKIEQILYKVSAVDTLLGEMPCQFRIEAVNKWLKWK
ncbi:MAG: hypothetical protein J6Y82_07850 [Bacteroidales bacterium]|nr:hypothetical protein [Bacteroidales bacterium]